MSPSRTVNRQQPLYARLWFQVIVGIIVVSCIPMAVEYFLARRRAKHAAAA